MAAAVLKELHARLSTYDGRATTLLGEAEAACATLPAYADALIVLAGDAGSHVSAGATWLLKSALEQGEPLSAAQADALVEQLPKAQDWAVQLHLCQCMQYVTLSPSQADRLAEWLEPLLAHDRPFLRAWAVDALSHCALANPAHQATYDGALATALEDEAASVRARARQLVRA